MKIAANGWRVLALLLFLICHVGGLAAQGKPVSPPLTGTYQMVASEEDLAQYRAAGTVPYIRFYGPNQWEMKIIVNVMKGTYSRKGDDLTLTKSSVNGKKPQGQERDPVKLTLDSAELTLTLGEISFRRVGGAPVRKPTGNGKEEGEYFVIIGTFSGGSWELADRSRKLAKSRGLAASVIKTDSYPGLKPGLVAVVLGPTSRSIATRNLKAAKKFYPDSYIKKG